MLLFGSWLRFAELGAQTPFHDEWHALFAVDGEGFGELGSRFGIADHSIPVAWWLEALTRFDRLNELTLWLPGAAASLVLLTLLAARVGARLGVSAGLLYGSALILSPAFVYFARSARPYSWCVPLALLSVFWLTDWLASGARWAFARWLAAALAVGWSLPVFVPFVAAPAFLGVLSHAANAGGNEMRARRRRALGASLAFGAGLAIAFAMPLLEDAPTLVGKTFQGELGLSASLDASALALGAWPAWTVLPLAVLAAIGSTRVPDRATTSLLVLGAVVQVLAVLLVRPAGISSPLVLGRYWLPAGAVLLLLAACGAGALVESRGAGWRLPLIATAALAVGAATWLPKRSLLVVGADNFRSTKHYHLLFFSPGEIAAAFPELPAAYRSVRDDPGSFAILELPYNGYLRTPYPYYQLTHRREVYLGVERGWCTEQDTRELPSEGGRGFHLSRFVNPGEIEALRARSIRFVIFHRDPEAEVPWVRPERRRRDRFDFDGCVERFRSESGLEPSLAPGLALFDLGPFEPPES